MSEKIYHTSGLYATIKEISYYETTCYCHYCRTNIPVSEVIKKGSFDEMTNHTIILNKLYGKSN